MISLDFDSIEQRQAWEDGADTEFKDQQQPKGKAKNILEDKEIEEAEYSIIDDEIPDDELPDFMREEQGDE